MGLGKVFDLFWNIFRWSVSAALLSVAMALVYYYAPDVEQQRSGLPPAQSVGVCLLAGGEINAKIEHAAPAGKAPGQKTSL